MKYYFKAELKLHIELADNLFKMLWECCEKHYSDDVKALIRQGGTLFGAKNRREWSKGKDQEIYLTYRQADTVLKALELDHTDNANHVKKTVFTALELMINDENALNRFYKTTSGFMSNNFTVGIYHRKKKQDEKES